MQSHSLPDLTPFPRLRQWFLPLLVALAVLPGLAHAVPSFARQMGMQCSGCHTVFPELNNFGRQFKLRGFTLGNASADATFPRNLPVSMLVQISQTNTSNTNGIDAGMLPRDRKTTLQAAGLYYAGRISERTGALVQYNYDGIERKWAVEMVDLRFADSTTVTGGRDLLYGITLNNAPTVTDLWNSTPMWSFPHVDPAGLMPAAATLIDMRLGSQVGGVTAYGFFDNLFYGEWGLYRSAKTGLLRPLGAGVEKSLVLDRYAPYWRLALQRDFDAHSISVGAYGLIAKVFPDPTDTRTASDRFRDIAFDAQYQYSAGVHALSSHVTYIRERQDWRASFAQDLVSNPSSTLKTMRADVHYFYERTFGGGVQVFSTRGDADSMRYGMGPVMGSANGKPNTRGWIAELNYLPLESIKLSLRRTAFREFNGARSNYDGFGRNASDNNNWLLLAWFMF